MKKSYTKKKKKKDSQKRASAESWVFLKYSFMKYGKLPKQTRPNQKQSLASLKGQYNWPHVRVAKVLKRRVQPIFGFWIVFFLWASFTDIPLSYSLSWCTQLTPSHGVMMPHWLCMISAAITPQTNNFHYVIFLS